MCSSFIKLTATDVAGGDNMAFVIPLIPPLELFVKPTSRVADDSRFGGTTGLLGGIGGGTPRPNNGKAAGFFFIVLEHNSVDDDDDAAGVTPAWIGSWCLLAATEDVVAVELDTAGETTAAVDAFDSLRGITWFITLR